MKKNIMMRAASALLVAVLLTTCSISGTFAKYTTSATASDTARVAKWGVTVEAKGNMFGQHYVDKTDGDGISATTTGIVDSQHNDNIIAPGTKGTLTKSTISGTPEVKVEVSFEGTVTLNEKWLSKFSNEETGETYYCPIKITVKGKDTNTTINGLEYTSEAGFKSAIEEAINGVKYTVDAGNTLSNSTGDYLDISWEWPFEGPNNGNEGKAATGTQTQTDYADTYLGNKFLKTGSETSDDIGKLPTIKVEVATTVTQVD